MVRMHRRRGGVTGIYSCEILDDNAEVQILYIGIYTNNTGKLTFFLHRLCAYNLSCFHLTSGALEVTSLQFQLTSELNATTPTFTLTCTSTGGPATTVSWTVNNHTVTEDSAHNITSQILTDPETATYNHTLTVTGRLEGQYECTVSNNKSSSNRSLMVVGMYCVGACKTCLTLPLLLQVPLHLPTLLLTQMVPPALKSPGFHQLQKLL